MGIVPLQYSEGDTAESLGLTGKEKLSILMPASNELRPRQTVTVKVEDTGKTFEVVVR